MRSGLGTWLVAACLLAWGSAAAQNFEPHVELTVAGVPGNNPDIATDGRGKVFVTWWTDDGSFGRDSDVVVVRSVDGGATWTAPALIDPTAASDSVGSAEVLPRILTGGQGTWIALWSRDLLPSSATQGGVFVARWTDAEAAWSAPVRLGAGGGRIGACTDGRGTWLVVLSQGTAAQIARSVDDARTWGTESAPAGLVEIARCEQRPVGLIETPYDGNGVRQLHAVVAGADGRLQGGATTLLDGAYGYTGFRGATLAADPTGRVSATWEASDKVFTAASADGTVWSAAAAVPTPPNVVFNGSSPFVGNGGAGRWLLVWGGPSPKDNVLGSSDGQTWTQSGERGGWDHAVAADGAGGWVAAWQDAPSSDRIFFGHAQGTSVTTTTTLSGGGGGATTTTLPSGPCTNLDCELQNTLATSCAGVTLPKRSNRKLAVLLKQIDRVTAGADDKKSVKLSKKVRRRLEALRTAILRYARGKNPKLTQGCSQALASTLTGALGRLEGLCGTSACVPDNPTTTSTTIPAAPRGCEATVGGSCWFLGVAGASCTATCVAAGRAYDPATESHAGSGGTTANCEAVLSALGLPGQVENVSCDTFHGSPAVGCVDSFPPHFGASRCTAPPTSADASLAGARRACACS
jgi:hypothetical protein